MSEAQHRNQAETETGIVIRPERARSVFLPATLVAVMLSFTASGSWTAALWFRSMTERLRAIEIAVASIPNHYASRAQVTRAVEWMYWNNRELPLVIPEMDAVWTGGRLQPMGKSL